MTKTTKAAIEAMTEANVSSLTKHQRSAGREAAIAVLAAAMTVRHGGRRVRPDRGRGHERHEQRRQYERRRAAAGSDAGHVSFTSGGVGLDESHALIREQAHWPLSLRFTGPTSDYLSDVHVRITDAKNAEVLKTDAMGPYMLVKLAPGHYTVYAKYKDSEKKQGVTVAGNGKAKADFHWSMQ